MRGTATLVRKAGLREPIQERTMEEGEDGAERGRHETKQNKTKRDAHSGTVQETRITQRRRERVHSGTKHKVAIGEKTDNKYRVTIVSLITCEPCTYSDCPRACVQGEWKRRKEIIAKTGVPRRPVSTDGDVLKHILDSAHGG